MSNGNTAVTQRPASGQVQSATGEVDFQPFGAVDRIKLNVTIVQTLCAVATKQGHLPTREDAIRFMMLCRAQRLNPFAGDAFLIGYDTKNGPKFNLITAHVAFLKRAEVHPEFDGMSSGVIVSPGWDCAACSSTGLVSDNGKPTVCPLCLGKGKRDEVEGDFVPDGQDLVGAWAHVKLKSRSIATHRRSDFKAIRPEFGGPIWDKNPAMMAVKTVEADALRSTFPTLLGGLYTAGEQPIDLLGDNADRSKELAGIAPPPTRKQVAALSTRLESPTPRNGPTLVEEPLSADEQAEASAGLAPEPQQEQQKQGEGPQLTTVQKLLADAVAEAKVSFEDWRTWAIEQFSALPGLRGVEWDSMEGFASVNEKVCRLCIGARAGMIDELKGGAK